MATIVPNRVAGSAAPETQRWDGIITLEVNHGMRYYTNLIRSFKCEHTDAMSKGHRVRQFVNIAKVARRKPRQIETADRLEDLNRPAIILTRSRVIVLVNTAFASTINGESA